MNRSQVHVIARTPVLLQQAKDYQKDQIPSAKHMKHHLIVEVNIWTILLQQRMKRQKELFVKLSGPITVT